jgi:hypothetical protein
VVSLPISGKISVRSGFRNFNLKNCLSKTHALTAHRSIFTPLLQPALEPFFAHGYRHHLALSAKLTTGKQISKYRDALSVDIPYGGTHSYFAVKRGGSEIIYIQ